VSRPLTEKEEVWMMAALLSYYASAFSELDESVVATHLSVGLQAIGETLENSIKYMLSGPLGGEAYTRVRVDLA
jgi:hypothetical protein